MKYARDACASFDRTRDPIYLEIAAIHCRTARIYNRNAWRGPRAWLLQPQT